jgi:hypothetical protein
MDTHRTSIHEEHLRLRQILGGCTVAGFWQRPVADRQNVYRAYLQSTDTIISMSGPGDGFMDMPNDGTMLLQEYYMGYDYPGKRLVAEAREFFYGANQFAVPSHLLEEFAQDPLTDGSSVNVARLVDRVIVRVRDGDSPNDEAGTRGLHHLATFTNATQVDIELAVGGAVNGLDLTTQQVIRDIAVVVKGLIDQFQDKLSIRTESTISMQTANIRPYWDPPTTASIEKLRQGQDCSPEELMQIQIAKWTGVLPKVRDVHGDAVSPL